MFSWIESALHSVANMLAGCEIVDIFEPNVRCMLIGRDNLENGAESKWLLFKNQKVAEKGWVAPETCVI